MSSKPHPLLHRLIAAKKVKEVVYQTAGYNQAAMMAGLKQGPAGPVYMPHMPGMFGTPPYSQYYPVSGQGIIFPLNLYPIL